MSTHDAVLLPFHQSEQARHAYIARTQSLLTALTANDDVTLLTLPTIERGDERRPTSTYIIRTLSDLLTLPTIERGDERRPTSTYIIRTLSDKELTTLLDPQLCNCRFASEKASIKIMYRVAGNGEGGTMQKWDMSSSLKAQGWGGCVECVSWQGWMGLTL